MAAPFVLFAYCCKLQRIQMYAVDICNALLGFFKYNFKLYQFKIVPGAGGDMTPAEHIGVGRILIVEADAIEAMVHGDYLTQRQYAVDVEHSLAAARTALARVHYDAVVLDLHLPDGDSTALVADIRVQGLRTAVVILTADPSMDTAVDALRAGAQNYLCKPVTAERLNLTLAHLREQHSLQRIVHDDSAADRDRFCDFIGASPAMQSVYHVLENAAQSKAPVMITGESGTGKELAARALHMLGPRRMKPFEALNCAAVPHNLLESEVFGHVRGAFTGALNTYSGAAARAHEGTLFLDELAEMPLDMQSKLLRFTQSGVFRPLGAGCEVSADVRFICATNRAPMAAVTQGYLREDLYYRLNVISLHLPLLRERGKDILLIAAHFVTQMAAEEGKEFTCIAPDAAAWLMAQPWPGNVRQLQNVIRRAIVMNDGNMLTADMLSADMQMQRQPPPALTRAAMPMAVSLREMEKQMIEHTIQSCRGNISAAARQLGVNPSTLHRKLGKWRKGTGAAGSV